MVSYFTSKHPIAPAEAGAYPVSSALLTIDVMGPCLRRGDEVP